jgi:formate C-acetyltransferase
MIDVRTFIQENYTEYLGDSSFLHPISMKTSKLWKKCKELLKQEQENGGVLDIETSTFSGITNFEPGYIDKYNEVIVGLQTDAPLKRIINPYGGMRMVE